MNRAGIVLMLLFSFFSFIHADTQTGFFVSVKDIEMRVDFSGMKINTENISRDFEDLFLKLSNISPGKIEFSLIVNLSKGFVVNDENLKMKYTHVGVGAELGKILNLYSGNMFGKKCTLDMVWGISGIVYFNVKSKSDDIFYSESEDQKEKLLYDFGLFTSLKIGISLKKVNIYTGFQSIYPIISNSILADENIGLIRSYIFIGVTF